MFANQSILVTGGTGSWGQELVRQLLEREPREIRIFSRGELAQVNMSRTFNNQKLTFIIGDIRDEKSIEDALEGIDYVFHLAALKHVPVCEIQPSEAIKTNILGTENLIKAAIKKGVKKVIDVSTDKAVNPLNLYGMTKAVGEKLIIQGNLKCTETQFVCIRAGNVLGSNGSIVPYFKKQIELGGPITLTSSQMTRYFITLKEAIALLFKASEESVGGETFVMRMPAYQIKDIAEVLIKKSGKKDIKIEEIGVRPGEKLNEVLVSEYEVSMTYMYDEHYYVILPTLSIPKLEEYYATKALQKVCFNQYTSADLILGKDAIEDMLDRDGF